MRINPLQAIEALAFLGGQLEELQATPEYQAVRAQRIAEEQAYRQRVTETSVMTRQQRRANERKARKGQR